MYPKRVSRVRISLSPQPATAQRASAGLFWYAADASLLVDDGYQNGPNDRQVVGLLRGCPDPPGGHRDAASAAPRNLALSSEEIAVINEQSVSCVDFFVCPSTKESTIYSAYNL